MVMVCRDWSALPAPDDLAPSGGAGRTGPHPARTVSKMHKPSCEGVAMGTSEITFGYQDARQIGLSRSDRQQRLPACLRPLAGAHYIDACLDSRGFLGRLWL